MMLRIVCSKLVLILCLGSILALVAPGCRPASSATDAAATSVRPRVSAARPENKTIYRSFTQPGQIDPFDIARLYAKVPAYVERYLADIGDTVSGPRFDEQGKLLEHGQLLAELSAPELKQELEQKRALLAQSNADVEQSEAGIKVAESAVVSSAAQLKEVEAAADRADAELARWRSEYDRVVQLVSRSVVNQKLADETKAQFEAAQAGRREATARIESARAAVVSSDRQLEKSKADEAAARARRQVAEADVARLLALNDYLRIEAPFDGVISERHAEIGNFASAGGQAGTVPLYIVVRMDRVRVFIDLPEMEAPLVKVGNRAAVRVRSLGGSQFDGTVTRTAWALDPEARTLHAEVDIPNSDGQLRPGMYAEVTVELGRSQSGVIVPQSAVVKRQNQAWCFVAKNGKSVRKPVTLGVSDAALIEIASGLDSNDLVITNPAGLADGQPVELSEPPAAK